ncbi:MAG: RNA polymerase sigma factor [Acidobacteriota bacterium]
MTIPLPVGARSGVIDPDAAELERARAGDEAAFEILVSRHERTVWLVARRLLGHDDEALDAAQDTFLRVFRALPRFRGEATFRTWVIGIAINVCRNRLASAERRRSRLNEELIRTDPATGRPAERPLPDPSPGPEAATHAGELRAALDKALASLTTEHREVVVLREVEGLDYEELGRVLGCRVGTVKSRLARARAALRAALEGVWP